MISLTYHRIDRSLCPLCLEWFLPLPRQQECILEYILPTKSKRAGRVLYERETGLFEGFKEKFIMNPEESKALYRQLRNNLEISLREKGV
ncbi:hypothetical protein [Microcystis aeruginosa]|uniref:hypothetical protein n=1 Tax=Microcystis aeruginosa TaxID=1126 RepID=UPI00209C3B0F|nr:hypothetical protein [Microcystis aeruginosa]